MAGFAGIVAAIRQRRITSWAPEQLVLLQILFTASAAAIFYGLLPAFLSEAIFDETLIWKLSSALLIVWIAGAVWYRLKQSRRLDVSMQIPKVVLGFGVISIAFQIYNIVEVGSAWPYLLGITTMLLNGFSVFLLLVLKPTDD